MSNDTKKNIQELLNAAIKEGQTVDEEYEKTAKQVNFLNRRLTQIREYALQLKGRIDSYNAILKEEPVVTGKTDKVDNKDVSSTAIKEVKA